MLIDRVAAMAAIETKANAYRLVSLVDVRDALNSLEGIDPATFAPRWVSVKDLKDLPNKSGEYLVNLHIIGDFFGESDEREQVASAYFDYKQKLWEITPERSINALLPIFDVYDTFTTDYIDYWAEMPEPPKEGENDA